MKTILNTIIVLACLCLPIGIHAQHAMTEYKLDPKKKTWMQSIRTFSKSGKWAKPDPKASGSLTPESSWAKWKGAFPELKSTSQYIGAAYAFKTQRPSGTLKKTLKNGHLVQYHDPSKVFAAYTKSGYILTMFRAKEGKKFYDKVGVDPKYTYPGYIKVSSKTRSVASSPKPPVPTSPVPGTKPPALPTTPSPGSSPGRPSTPSPIQAQHTTVYFMSSYRPKPGVSTWLKKPSSFPKIASSKWHEKENVPAAQNAKEKYTKHKAAFPEIKSLLEYIAVAHQFKARRPSGTLKKTMKNGDTVQYHEPTNVFAAYNKAGMPRTMFRPKAGINYYKDLESVKIIQYDGFGEKTAPKVNSTPLSNVAPPNESGESIRSSQNYLVNTALQCTSIEHRENRTLNILKSWDAVKQVMVSAQMMTSTEAKSINSSTQLVNSGDNLIKGWSQIPEGQLIGFFVPTSSSPVDAKGPAPGKKEKLIHLMISSGNGKAIGTGNKIIGIGNIRGWEEIDLSILRYNPSQKYFIKGKGSSETEVYVRSYDPNRGFKNRAANNPVTNIGGIEGDEDKRIFGSNNATNNAKLSSNDLLYQIAKKSTNINTAEHRLLNTKKSKDAVVHVLKLTKRCSEKEIRELYRDLNTTNLAPGIVDDISILPPGYVLRFISPKTNDFQEIKGHTWNKNVKEIHTMITTGNGKAIGTENTNIGLGSIRGWEEIDLKSKLKYNRELRYFELIKNNHRSEVYITYQNPFGPIDPKYQNAWDGSENHADNRSYNDSIREHEGESRSGYPTPPAPANYQDPDENSSDGYAQIPESYFRDNDNKSNSRYENPPPPANNEQGNTSDNGYGNVPKGNNGDRDAPASKNNQGKSPVPPPPANNEQGNASDNGYGNGPPEADDGYSKFPPPPASKNNQGEFPVPPPPANNEQGNASDNAYGNGPPEADDEYSKFPPPPNANGYGSGPAPANNKQADGYGNVPKGGNDYGDVPQGTNTNGTSTQLPNKIDQNRLAKIAMDLCTPNTPQEKALGFKKSWDAVEHMLVLSDYISIAEAKKKIAFKDIINSKAPKVTRIQSVPSGLIIGLFVPLPTSNRSNTMPNERLVHMMVSLGNGKAVGTGNKATIGKGLPKGIEIIDLAAIDNNLADGTFDVNIGSRSEAYIIRAINADGSTPNLDED